MKIQCPNCHGEGCKRCEDTDYMEGSFAEGDWYTRHCPNEECGFNNGGRIVPYGIQPVEDEWDKDGCVVCGGPIKYMLMSEAPESDAWQRNEKKFTIKRQKEIIERLVDNGKKLRSLIQRMFEGETKFTIAEYRQMNLCRVCRKPGADVYNYGKEHAHKDCLEIGEYPWDVSRN